MHPKHYENVLALTSEERYDHFLVKVADWEQLWSLYSKEGWLERTTPEGVKYISVWPHPDYAKEIAKEYYPEHIEKEISLKKFMNEWLPKLENDNIKIGVFPSQDGTNWLISPKELLEDIKSECKLYE